MVHKKTLEQALAMHLTKLLKMFCLFCLAYWKLPKVTYNRVAPTVTKYD